MSSGSTAGRKGEECCKMRNARATVSSLKRACMESFHTLFKWKLGDADERVTAKQ